MILRLDRIDNMDYPDIRPFHTEGSSHTKYYYNGVQIPSVTTVLKMLSNDALIYWANSLGWNRRSVKDELSIASYIGTTIHEYVYHIIQGNKSEALDILQDLKTHKNLREVDGILSGVASFNEWWSDNKEYVVPVFAEEPLSMPHCGGTVDLVCYYKNKLTIIDFKSSKSVYLTHWLQLAKCKEIYEYNFPQHYIEELAVLHIDKNDHKPAKMYTLMDTISTLGHDDPLNKLTHDEVVRLLQGTYNAILNSYMHLWNFNPLK